MERLCDIVSNSSFFFALGALGIVGVFLWFQKQVLQTIKQIRKENRELHEKSQKMLHGIERQGKKTFAYTVLFGALGLLGSGFFSTQCPNAQNGANGTVTETSNGGDPNGGDPNGGDPDGGDPDDGDSNDGDSNDGEGLAGVLGEIHQTLENIEGTLQGPQDAAEKPAPKAAEKPAPGMQADLSALLAEMKTLNKCVMQITKDIGGIRKALPTPPAKKPPPAPRAVRPPAKKAPPAAGGEAAGKAQGSGNAGGQAKR